jgi:hypothetical protein
MKIPFLQTWTTVGRTKTSYGALLLSVAILFTGCSKDNENDINADAQKIVGSYAVEDTDEWDEVENYSISIDRSNQGGSNIEISNFGDIMYVPVKAVFKGNTLNIPSQTFTGKTVTITISGQGTLSGNNLDFDYVIETDDNYQFEHSCIAVK